MTIFPPTRELKVKTQDMGWSRPPLTANQRLHWAARAKLTREIRYAAAVWFHTFGPVKRCEVSLIWYVTDARRRDADNAFPTLKAACDGIVDAGIVPDDTPNLMVKLMPQIVRTTQPKPYVTLTVRELP
jgi:crossover junction endodeoxyribonuclease RusA